MIVGIAAQAADPLVDGIGLAVQGLTVLILAGEALLQVSDGVEIIGQLAVVEPIGELYGPAAFGLEFGSQLPEAGDAAYVRW